MDLSNGNLTGMGVQQCPHGHTLSSVTQLTSETDVLRQLPYGNEETLAFIIQSGLAPINNMLIMYNVGTLHSSQLQVDLVCVWRYQADPAQPFSAVWLVSSVCVKV